MKKRFLPFMIIASLVTTGAIAQQAMLYDHYYVNPFLYNPSYIASSGYSELNLNFRKQWVGIDGAPTTSTLNFQLPLNYKTGLAFTAIQDEAGLLKTTTGLISFSYAIHFGKKATDVNKLSFGLSAGVINSRIDATKADDQSDPVLGNNTTSMDGQFGLHYRYNNFRIGFAIPRIFETKVASEDGFSKPGISSLDNTISSISYDFHISDRFSFEPMVTYRTYQTLDPLFEALGTLKFFNVAWVGGAYRQNYGGFGYLGFNIKQKLKIAYAYEFATTQTDLTGSGSHDVQLIFRIGKKQHSRQQTAAATKTPVVAAQQQQTQTKPEDKPVEDKPVIVPVPVESKPAPATTLKPQEQPVQEAPKPVQKLNGDKLPPGHYVVVGVFNSGQNALSYMATLKRAGYPANVAYDPQKKNYVVHMDKPAENLEDARVQRNKYRGMSRYSLRDTWILSIE